MKRIVLTDSSKWFDADSAVKFDESTRWNGNNHISRATGSQWDHEALYYTRSGRWVINSWSQWQGSLESYTEISETEAIEWLISQEYGPDDISELPANVRESVESGIAAAEL